MAEVINLPFGRGIEEGADPKSLAPGTPIVLLNRYVDKAGRVRKRWGVTSKVQTIVGGGSISAGKRLLTRGDDLAVFDGTTLYSWASPLTSWTAVDRPPPLSATRKWLADSTRSVTSIDIAITGDFLVVAYIVASTGYLFYEVRSLSTNAVIVPTTLLVASSCGGPRVLINGAGTKAYIVYTYADNVAVITLTLATLAVSAATVLANDSRTVPSALDAVIGSSASVETLYIAYETQAGASRLKLAAYTLSTLVAGSTLTEVGTGIIHVCLSVGALAGSVSVAFSSTTSSLTRVWTVSSSLGASVVGPTTVYAGTSAQCFVAEASATQLLVGWLRDDGIGTDAGRLTTALYSVAAHAQTAASERITFNVYQVSKPWSVSSRWYAQVITWVHPYSVTLTDPVAAPSCVVVEVETEASITGNQDATHPHVATLEDQIGWYTPSFLCQIKSAVDASGNVYIPAAVRGREPATYLELLPASWTIHKLATGASAIASSAQVGGSALCVGAAPFWYDGATTLPYGFAHAPQIITTGASNNGGVIVAGVYGYVAVYVWPDANGLKHRSVPSSPKTGTTAGANLTVDVRVSTASLSGKQRTTTATQAAKPVLIEVYRTTINGDTYYRLTLEPSQSVLTNDPRAADVTLRDTKADADIWGSVPAITLSTRAQLYSSSALEDVPPPASLAVLSHKDRLWLVASDEHTVWPSKAFSDDPEYAPGFNEALTLSYARPKNALGSLDEMVVVLGPDSIDFVAGNGPDNQGNGAWDRASMQTDVGCIESRSVVSIPQGLVFQSRRSLELLTRERTLSWFGQPVQDTLDAYPTITSAVVVPDQHQVRFTCNNSGLTDGLVLVFDYARGLWSQFDYGFTIADACMVGGVYTMLRYSGTVFQEDTATHLDDGVYVASAVEVVASAFGPNAWHRLKDVQVLGTSSGNHDLTIKVRRDFATTYEQTKTFAAQSDVTTIGVLEKARMTLARQKGQGFAIRIEDATPTTGSVGIGAGPILEGLALYVQRKEGLPKVSGSRKG